MKTKPKTKRRASATKPAPEIITLSAEEFAAGRAELIALAKVQPEQPPRVRVNAVGAGRRTTEAEFFESFPSVIAALDGPVAGKLAEMLVSEHQKNSRRSKPRNVEKNAPIEADLKAREDARRKNQRHASVAEIARKHATTVPVVRGIQRRMK